jgi:uncharacterized RDD family membrane protein YckC
MGAWGTTVAIFLPLSPSPILPLMVSSDVGLLFIKEELMSRSCPSCGAIDYGTPFCVSCQKPLSRSSAASLGTDGLPSLQPQISIKAGFFRRFAALAIDWLTLSVIADILSFAYRIGRGFEPREIHLDIAMGLSVVLIMLYFTLLTGEGGQTLGKMLLGIKVQCTDGSRAGYGRAFIRTLGYIVSFFFMTFLGFLWALWDRNKQAWHDKIAGTEVVKV